MSGKWKSTRMKNKKEELGLNSNNSQQNDNGKEESKSSVDFETRSTNSDTSSNTSRGFSGGRGRGGGGRGGGRGSGRGNDGNRGKNNSYSSDNRNHRGYNNRQKYLVKISGVPSDLDSEELLEQVREWGEVSNVSIKQYKGYDEKSGTETIENTCAFINFYNRNAAEYFRDAHHGTTLGHMIIAVEIKDEQERRSESERNNQLQKMNSF